jgi:hypothetical protein
MTITYTPKENEIGYKYIELLDSDKPNSVTVIPIDEANSDYQRYLRWLENPEAETAIPPTFN